MRGNYRTPFDLVIENPGNVDAVDVPLWVTGIPSDATVGLDFSLAYPLRSGLEPDWTQAPLTFPDSTGQYLVVMIPRVPPGATARRIAGTVPASADIQLRAALAPPWVDGAVFRACLSDGGATHDPNCLGAQLAGIASNLVANPSIEALSGVAMWAKIGWQCEG